MRGLVVLAFLAAMVPSAVSAHARLIGSTPAANGVGSSVSSIDLRFSERIVPKLSNATLTMLPATKPIAAAAMPGSDGKSLKLSLSRPLASGLYRVDYHVTSADTHRVGGSLSFHVK